VAFLVVYCEGEQARPFTTAENALLETFANQAVSALKNTRLFTELRARDDRRRQEPGRASTIQRSHRRSPGPT